MSIFLFGIFLFLFIVVAIISLGMYLLSALLGGFGNLRNLFYKLIGWKKGRHSETDKSSHASSSEYGKPHNAETGHRGGGKIFGSNEGVYVDYEEVK